MGGLPSGQQKQILPLISFLFLCTSISDALAQWRSNQRQYALNSLRDDELRQLARLTDAQSIRTLLKPILVERQVGTPQHDAVAHYLQTKAQEFGFTTEWDTFTGQTPHGQKPFHNLIATFDPLVHRRLVLACHYDSKIMPGKLFIGATDSALPCALLLDIAKTLAPMLARRSNQKVTLQLLFLDGEEAFEEWSAADSIYGARHLADVWQRKWYPSSDGSAFELSREIDRIDVFVLLDLLGAKNPRLQGFYGHGTNFLSEQLPAIEEDLRRLGLLNRIPKIFFPGTSFSAVEDDHIPFLRRGVPILHLIPVPFPSVWHDPKDDESAMDNPTIENLASVLRVFVARYLGIHPTEQ